MKKIAVKKGYLLRLIAVVILSYFVVSIGNFTPAGNLLAVCGIGVAVGLI